MVSSILVPTDFSENAKVALAYAHSLAQKYQAKLIIGNAYDPFYSAFQSEDSNEADRCRAEEEAREAMDSFLESFPGKQGCTLSFLPEDFEDAVPKWVDKHQIDLVVMGTKGASGMSAQLLGSSTLETVKTVDVPVIVVPSGTDNFRLEQVAFFTDYQLGDSLTLRCLLETFGNEGKYRFIHIHESQSPLDQEEQQLSQWVQALTKDISLQELAWNVVEGEECLELVHQVAADGRIDLLALTMTERGFLDELFNKSLAKAIIHQPSTPVFLVNKKAARRIPS